MSSRYVPVLIVFLLITGILFTMSSAFAYWQEVTVPKDVNIITIGEGVEIIVEDLNTDTEQVQLVPKGYALFVGDVEQVELTYVVGVSKELLSSANLHVEVISVLIGDDDTYGHLIDIEIMGSKNEAVIEMFNDSIEVSVVVRLIEPIDLAEAIKLDLDESMVNVEDSVLAYETIKGQNVQFIIRFELRNKN